MAKGAGAKEYVVNKLREAFGDDYIGEVDKKYYVWGREAGQKMQIAIALTCPKTPVGEVSAAKEAFDWSDSEASPAGTTSVFKPAQIDDDERARVAELMAKLGL